MCTGSASSRIPWLPPKMAVIGVRIVESDEQTALLSDLDNSFQLPVLYPFFDQLDITFYISVLMTLSLDFFDKSLNIANRAMHVLGNNNHR